MAEPTSRPAPAGVLRGTRLCLVTPEYPPSPGGVGISAARIVAALVAAGAHVTVVTRAVVDTGDDVPLETAGAVEVHRLAHGSPFSSEAAFALRQRVRQLDEARAFDAFQGCFLNEAFACLQRPGAGTTRPVIASIHGDDVRTRLGHPLWRGTILSVLRRASWVTSPSQEYLDRAAAEVSLDGRASIIRNAAVGIDGSRGRWQVTDRIRGVVGTVGEFRPVKDIPLLVRGYAGVRREERRGLVLGGYFVSADDQRATMALADTLGVADELRLTGRLSRAEVARLLTGLHVYVQASRHEALPNALLEAAALGVPLVATAVGGIREVIGDGVHGLLVPPGDARALAAAVETVMGDDGVARRLSAGALALADALSPEREAVEWTTLYARLLRRDW